MRHRCLRLPALWAVSALVLVTLSPLSARGQGKNVASETSAAPGTSAEQLVREAATALAKLNSYELSVVSSQAVDDGRYTRTLFTYLDSSVERSGTRCRFRVFSKKGTAGVTIVSDGDSSWIYDEYTRQYEHRQGDPPPDLLHAPTPGFAGALSAENLPTSLQSAEVERPETLAVGDRQEPCDVVLVRLKPDAAPEGYRVKDGALRLWLSREYRVPMKVSATLLHDGPNGKPEVVEMKVTVTKFHPNVQLPPLTWTFVRPEGSQPALASSAPNAK
jgi:outer membrane lipoprotein-sorting protein